MACLKCGRETAEKEVFCPDCQNSMAQETPVKSGTRVSIPKRPAKEVPYAPVKKQTPEEQIEKLRVRIRLLLALVAALCLGLCVTIGIIVVHLSPTDQDGFGIGQNYSTEAPDNVDHGR